MEFLVKDLKELEAVAKKLCGDFLPKSHLVLLYGKMGAGKTTFMKAVGKVLGIEDEVSSPTFSVINEYLASSGSVYHIDLYRLENQLEALNIGIMDQLTGDRPCFIEWPDLILDLLAKPYVSVILEECPNGDRLIKLQSHVQEKV